MEYQRLNIDLGDLFPLAFPRSKGIHVSEVIRDIAIRYGFYDRQDEPDYKRMMLGQAIEWALINALDRKHPGRFIRGTEVQHDGLLLTPDLLEPDIDFLYVHEIKFLRMSSEHPLTSDKYWAIHAQIKSYCRALNTRQAVLHVFHSDGNYKDRKVDYAPWYIEYTDAEIAQNWELITRHAREMQSRSQSLEETAAL
jgi:hypothetical protein